jgi:hypothetical protein
MEAPGSGPTTTVSVSLHKGTVEAVRELTGKREFSAFVEAAVVREIKHARLGELIADHVARYGEFSEEEKAAARALLHGDADGPTESQEQAAA